MPTITTDQIVCENCSVAITGGNRAAINPLGQYYCLRCMAAKCFVCADCNSYAFIHDRVIVQTPPQCHSDALCPDCAARQAILCSCGTRIYRNNAFDDDCGGLICRECFDTFFVECVNCGRTVHTDNVIIGEYDTPYCPACGNYEINFNYGTFINVEGFDKLGSRRCYGIELETASCAEYVQELKENAAWGAKNDCTITGKEFYSAILSGDGGLDAVRELADVATANNWTVDHSAGFHLHLDMRGEVEDSLWAIAHAYRRTQEVWLSFVEAGRHDGEYVHKILWDCNDLDAAKRHDDFDELAHNAERSDWANFSAYRVHQTIEIRLHHGTVDAGDVINWVKAHVRFADWASRLGYEGVRKALAGLTADELFTFIAKEVWDDPDLTIYYGDRAQMYRHGFLTKSIGG